MIYTRPIRVEFNHCDPAGIMFYPRYFEMTNSVSENFFRDVAGYPYEVMMAEGRGAPSAALSVTYHAPTRLGEVLDWRLTITRLGRSSLGSRLEAWVGESLRVTVDLTQVFVSAADGPQPWPAEPRARIAAFMEAT